MYVYTYIPYIYIYIYTICVYIYTICIYIYIYIPYVYIYIYNIYIYIQYIYIYIYNIYIYIQYIYIYTIYIYTHITCHEPQTKTNVRSSVSNMDQLWWIRSGLPSATIPWQPGPPETHNAPTWGWTPSDVYTERLGVMVSPMDSTFKQKLTLW